MAEPLHHSKKVKEFSRPAPLDSFDVTMKIATIELGEDRTGMKPHEAAFLAIANHDGDGKFSFRIPGDDFFTHVTVEQERLGRSDD